MRGQADTRLKNTTVGMLRERCCCEMGWWGYAKRKELQAQHRIIENALHGLRFAQHHRAGRESSPPPFPNELDYMTELGFNR
eukprot:3357361-Pyramimonas_sp.AAC.1